MSEFINNVPRELLERLINGLEEYDNVGGGSLDELRALLTEQPQASAAQSAPAGEREAFEKHLLGRNWDAGAAKSAAEELATWQRTQSAGVPDGWKLVPIQMTDEMRDAGNVYTLNRGMLVRIWADILAAALAQPAAQEPFAWLTPSGGMYRDKQIAETGPYGHICKVRPLYLDPPAQPAVHDQDRGEVQRLREALEGMLEYFPEGASDGECFAVDAARAALAASTGQEVE